MVNFEFFVVFVLVLVCAENQLPRKSFGADGSSVGLAKSGFERDRSRKVVEMWWIGRRTSYGWRARRVSSHVCGER